VQEILKVTKTGNVFEDASALNNLGIAYCEACRLEEVKMKVLVCSDTDKSIFAL
jgi:hypothetical protein